MIFPARRADRATDAVPVGTGRVLHRVLRVRLFYKILLANAALMTAAVAAVAATLGSTTLTSRLEVAGLAALAGVIASVAVNGLILRLALRPLERLQDAATRVGAGDFDARAPLSPLADRDLDRVIRTFNGTLDQLAVYRLRLRNIAARALSTAEEERKRIARDLHDDTAQTFASLLIRLRTARGSTSEADRTRLLDQLRDELSEAIDRMRRFAQGLRPPALDMLGLRPAIESHARRIAEIEGLRIDVDAEDVEGLLPEAAELALYRIVQEALSNAVRHARASRIRIGLHRQEDHLVATVEDDGRGFDPDAVEAGPDRGLGLFGMEERAAYIGGRIEVRSRIGAGTRVRASVPVPDSKAAIIHV